MTAPGRLVGADGSPATAAPRSLAVPSSATGDSLTVAGWTAVSRVTGLLRIAATGAVLGPTVLGNTFQFTNTLPNLIFYGLLAGSLFPSLLVPALVQHVDAGDRAASRRIAGGFLGVTLLALAVLVPVAAALAPVLLGLTAAHGPHVSAAVDQERVGRLLFLMFAPQVFCYAVVGTATATMNAHRRFGLAAAAPALENTGIVVVLCLAGMVFGQGTSASGQPRSGELLLLGLGTTTAVTAHAALQWWGAWRAGVFIRPFAGWRNPEVTALIRRALPSLGQAGVLATQILVLLAAANRTAGGVVAFQMALSFVYLAIALGVTPVALTSLPRLARLRAHGELELFHDTFLRAVGLCFFVAVPAAVGCLALAPLLARTVAVGRMAEDGGVMLVAVSLAALAAAILGQAGFTICSYAFYAQKDTGSPLRAAVVQAATCLLLVMLALRTLDGTALLAGLGLAYSLGAAVGAVSMGHRLSPRFGTGPQRLLPSLAGTGLAAALMAGPVWATGHVVASATPGRGGAVLGILSASLLGLATFLGVQALLRAPELGWLVQGVGHRRRLRGDAA